MLCGPMISRFHEDRLVKMGHLGDMGVMMWPFMISLCQTQLMRKNHSHRRIGDNFMRASASQNSLTCSHHGRRLRDDDDVSAVYGMSAIVLEEDDHAGLPIIDAEASELEAGERRREESRNSICNTRGGALWKKGFNLCSALLSSCSDLLLQI